MKRLLSIILFLTAFTAVSQDQINRNGSPTTLSLYRGGYGSDSMWMLPVANLRVCYPLVDSIGWLQMNKKDSLLYFHNGIRWQILGLLPDMPRFNGLASQYVRANGTYATFPTIPTNNNQLSNGSGYITGITSTMVTSALGYTPPSAQNYYMNGYGLLKTGAEPSATFKVDTSTVVPTSRKITINGVTQDLSTNRSFTVSAPARIYSYNVYRSLNSNFTVSSTRDCFVSYPVTCQVSNPLLSGSSTASAFLEISTNGGSTWNIVSQAFNSSSVGVAVAISITNSQTVSLSGYIPAGALVRIRTVVSGSGSNTGSVTYAGNGIETQL